MSWREFTLILTLILVTGLCFGSMVACQFDAQHRAPTTPTGCFNLLGSVVPCPK